jgi:decaprenylphospho-beta-D-erythro-pentofuranosid-2-ulose 2-reductase
VHSAMTAGMKPAPFSTTPEVVANLTVKALNAGQRMVWTPGILRWLFMVLRHLPGPLWRRLPLG